MWLCWSKCDLVGEGVSLGLRIEVSEAHAMLSLFLPVGQDVGQDVRPSATAPVLFLSASHCDM